MSLTQLAKSRLADKRPVRAALIGAGKFGSMFLAQVPTIAGLEVPVIADLDPDKVRAGLPELGWDAKTIAATQVTDDGGAAASADVDVVIEATGNPIAGTAHALAAIEAGAHVVMVNVEADALLGPVLARRAAAAGVVYSMAYGDQPALIAEMIDWARSTGFHVAAAGKGTKYLPAYHAITHDQVWEHYGLTPEAAAKAGMNPRMFTSFMDGTKSALEMAAVANGCGLAAAGDGLEFPPCGAHDLAHVMAARLSGGEFDKSGLVEVVSSLERDGRQVHNDLRWGVYVVLEAQSDYAAACFAQYGLPTDASGRYAAMWKPFHLIGLELSISVLSAALRGEATGTVTQFNADAVCVAKRDLAPGDVLDGEGGDMVWGRLMPAAASLSAGALPMGLAHGPRLVTGVKAGAIVARADVDLDGTTTAARLRAEMEGMVFS
ncbi:Homoserine dehydrogenase [hydrothermal vent metagenome]|uniref:Homoserine dehydrogenase n=1 Tax=hydrothermal vent metagenome TaxID=652676 RepID=A0A3B0TII9_9ZZZZ